MDRRPRDVLAENLRALMKKSKDRNGTLGTIEQVAEASGVSKGVVERMTKAQSNTGIDHLQGIAKAFEMEAWQLMIPGLDATNPPMLAAVTEQQKALWDKLKKTATELTQLGT